MIRIAFIALWTVCGALGAVVTEESVIHAGVKFRVVRVAPTDVLLVWKDSAGTPYREFSKVQAKFSKEGKPVRFLMNAGIFEPGGIPSGLHMEGGKVLHPMNLRDAPGNFFLKPNGICGFGKKGAFVIPTGKWPEQEAGGVNWAVQSGPMLLIDGKRHPAFIENSTNRLHRNGAGVDDQNRLVFAITAEGQEVNFWDFAGLFLKMDCRNALFLDGDISEMRVNPTTPAGRHPFGAMFVIPG